jgi:Arc/MetJ-type ribon-helix-helix transcriptional regulator
MIRTQIQLTAEQAARLKRVTSRGTLSMAEVIRRALDSYLETVPEGRDDAARRQRAALAAGALRTGDPHLAAEHDAAFASSAAGEE